MKDLTNQEELSKQIPQTAKEFRFGNMILKITKSKNGTYGFVIKNTENPKFHHTLVAKDKPEMHFTKESDGITPNQHNSIDFEQFGQSLSNIFTELFSNAQILSLDDPRFTGKHAIMIVSQKMIVENSTRKKVNFDQEIEYEESLFEDIDVSENRIGIICDDNGNELCMIVINDGQIFKIDLEQLDSKDSEMNQIMRPEFD